MIYKSAVFIIFGATGDLSKRKIIPAIYQLLKDKFLKNFAILGLSFDDTTAKETLSKSRKFIKNIDEQKWQKLGEVYHYLQMDFHDTAKYSILHQTIKNIEDKHNLSGNRLFYLATMPNHFSDISNYLAKNDIAYKCTFPEEKPWYRVVYEKPFGNSLASSQKMNAAIKKVFCESQIFCIDHYLGKELIGNIALSRFTNKVLEPLWNRDHIDEVQIVLSETIGIEERGVFYDRYGVTKDMLQSHMLQMLALIAMEQPKKLTAQDIRNEKVKVLEKTMVKGVVKGQYEGYRQEKNVSPQSTTDTFVAAQLNINNERWRGVPFYLKTGKFLDKKETSIYIKFKKVDCLLTACPSLSNYLAFKISPNQGLYLGLNSKIPGTMKEVTPVKMEFCHNCLFGPNTPEAYETLLSDVITGDQSAFVRSDEIELSWKITEEVESIAQRLFPYKKGSSGLKEESKIAKNKIISWYYQLNV
jgi:glucose-6-phosphate 1-dehydrogenase